MEPSECRGHTWLWSPAHYIRWFDRHNHCCGYYKVTDRRSIPWTSLLSSFVLALALWWLNGEGGMGGGGDEVDADLQDPGLHWDELSSAVRWSSQKTPLLCSR